MLHQSFSDPKNSSIMRFHRSCRSTIILFDINCNSQSRKNSKFDSFVIGSSPPNKYPVDVDDKSKKLFKSKLLMT
jgi:hypothetical protein